MAKKNTIETLHRLAEKFGGNCLSKEYVNSKHKYEWICKNNHKWLASVNTIQRGSWCRLCFDASHKETLRTLWATGRYTNRRTKPKTLAVVPKKCSRCGEAKPSSAYSQKTPYRNGDKRFYSYCKECRIVYQRENRNKNQYGLQPGEWEILCAGQDYSCAICHRTQQKIRLAVDHDHKTGVTRGILCHRCNRLLGWVFDNPQILENAAAYLREPTAPTILGRVVQGLTGSIKKRRTRKKNETLRNKQ